MNNEEYQDYIEALIHCDMIAEMYLNQMEEEEGQQWVSADWTQFGCLFVNKTGDARYISAKYIDSAFEEE